MHAPRTLVRRCSWRLVLCLACVGAIAFLVREITSKGRKASTFLCICVCHRGFPALVSD